MRNVLLSMILYLLAGCSTTPTTYHSLAVNTLNAPVAAEVSRRLKTLGVGPIELPRVLDREGMVMRQNATSLTVSDTHLWGGQLEDEWLQALTQHLQARLPATRVQRVPWDISQTPQYQIVVKLVQFDAAPAGKAVVRGTWYLQTATDAKIISHEALQFERPVLGKGVDALVNAQSLLVGDVANQIVQRLSLTP